MQISFDLDGTLIPYNNEFPTEKRSWWAKLLGIEPIRKGTKTLIQFLVMTKLNTKLSNIEFLDFFTCLLLVFC